MKRPTIFLSNFHPFITRNILDAGVLDELKKRAGRIYVFVPRDKEQYLANIYADAQIEVIGVNFDHVIETPRETFFRRIAEILLDTLTKRNHQKTALIKTGKKTKYYLSRGVMFLLGHRPLAWIARPLFRFADLYLNNPDVFGDYFRKYRPDLVFITDPFAPTDILLYKSARKANVPHVILVRSWDNLVNKSLMRITPAKLIVQNLDMQWEAMKYHSIPKRIIHVSGVPQFEYYKRYTPISREEFCQSMGIDPRKRIILFSPAGKKFIDTDWQICEILKRFIAQGKIPSNVHIIVRLHPQNYSDLSKFVPDEHFTIEDPGVGVKIDRMKEIEMSRAKVDHLADELYHSSLIISIVSSIVIDAAVFDRPTITIGFNGWEKNVPYMRSVERQTEEEWLDVILKTGVTPTVRSPEELASFINAYLNDPALGRADRAAFVEKHCYKFDGKSAERIAEVVLGD